LHTDRVSCTLIVTAANEFAGRIHNRMPVFLWPENFAAWLDGSAGPELLKPAREELLQAWPVSKRVNRPGNDEDVSLVEPIEATGF
jgi:putative SOS response-associated peptidase YedK